MVGTPTTWPLPSTTWEYDEYVEGKCPLVTLARTKRVSREAEAALCWSTVKPWLH